MGYFKTYGNINEDAMTGAYNVFTRLVQGRSNYTDDVGIKRNMPLVGLPFGFPSFVKFADLNRLDKQRFRAYFRFNDNYKKELAKACKAQGGKLFTDREINQFKSEYERTPDKYYLNKASRDFGKGMLTTTTIDMQLPYGKDTFFIIYITFDADTILDIKVLTNDGIKKLTGIKTTGFRRKGVY